ncbi:hypothetical protein [Caedibacter taeniospiralis]|uniref:hypothetical protein n=1 Tax=Caedibacter taeniospiralis TaxID=28907 RepID=UPI000C2749CA|nr:hypothetical protein [Caedibacter taeniospiralis]
MKTTNEMLKYRTQRLIQMDKEEIANDKNANKGDFSDFLKKINTKHYRNDIRLILPYLRRNAEVFWCRR